MKSPIHFSALGATVIILLAMAPMAQHAQAGKEIACSSFEGAFNRCPLPGANQMDVRLTQNLGGAKCKRDYTWGADSDGVWVSENCSAVFTYSPKGSDEYHDHAVSQAECPQKWPEGSNECEYFKDGYKTGTKDVKQGKSNDYTRHNFMYDSRFEKPFKKGYKKGYSAHR